VNRLPDDEFQASMERLIEKNQNLDAEVVKQMRKIMEQREEILQAFVAKFGFEPEEAVQIEFRTKEGNPGWMVRKRRKEDPDATPN